jgi:hypothetical protein
MAAAKIFTIDDAVHAFGLKFRDELVEAPGGVVMPRWRIETTLETKGFVLTPCCVSLSSTPFQPCTHL